MDTVTLEGHSPIVTLPLRRTFSSAAGHRQSVRESASAAVLQTYRSRLYNAAPWSIRVIIGCTLFGHILGRSAGDSGKQQFRCSTQTFC